MFLIAPAGCGKTIALEETLAGRPGDIARVRCTSADREAGRLLDHLVDVLCAAAPGTADALRESLALAFGPVSADESAAELVGEIERLVIDPLTIVFDDAEHVSDDERAARVVGALVASDCDQLRVAVASRRPLPLRLAKLSAAGRLTIVNDADLAFDASECEELLRRNGRGDPTEDDVRVAMEVTEGWPLGLALRVSGRRGAASAGSAETLSAFLTEEVLDDLDPLLRDRVVRSSIAPELTPDLCSQLGFGDDFVDIARARNLFLRPVDRPDGDGRRFAYHPLFREHLLGLLERDVDAAELRDLHAALAGSIGDERPLDAVEHWLAAGREDQAIRLAGRNSQPLVRSSPEVVRGWLERLSPNGRSEPAMRLLEGQLAMGDGRPDDAVNLLSEAGEEWERRGSRAMWTARFSVALTMIVLGRFDEVPALADGSDEPETESVVAAPMVALMAGLALGGVGRSAEGQALIDRALAHPLGWLLRPYGDAYRAYFVDRHAGRLDAALAAGEHSAARLEELDPMRWMPYTLIYLASVREARGEDAEAVALLERSREFTRSYGLGGYPAAIAGAIKAGCDARAGRVADAEIELARAGPLLGTNWHAHEVEMTRAEIAARAGQPAEAVAAAERALALVEDGFLLERLRAAAILAPVLVDCGAAPAARRAIDRALEACPPDIAGARLLAQRAWLRDLDGDDDAHLDLVAAWTQAGEGVRFLVRAEWARVEHVVWEAVANGALAPGAVVEAVSEAIPGGDAVLELSHHADARVRRASAHAVAASGDPLAAARLDELAADDDAEVADAARTARARFRDHPPPLSFTLFGGFGVRRGGRPVAEEEWGRRIAGRLTRYLIVHRDQLVPEDLLFEAFWPDRPVEAARRGLQVALSAARAVLDPARGATGRVEVHERSYRLVLRPGDSVDTDRYERAARAALADSDADRVPALRAAVGLWGGDPLPEDRYETWATVWRERLIDLHAQLLGTLASSCLAAGDPFAAVAAGRRLVELDPLSEAAHRTLMTAFARSGRRGHALRQYLDCRRALAELGIEPAEDTAQLQRAILGGEAV